eukprot:12938487-Prorocentrum_lima.AAC.1
MHRGHSRDLEWSLHHGDVQVVPSSPSPEPGDAPAPCRTGRGTCLRLDPAGGAPLASRGVGP